MDFKYKIADVAKEFGVPAKKVIETVSGVTGETYKTGGTFGLTHNQRHPVGYFPGQSGIYFIQNNHR